MTVEPASVHAVRSHENCPRCDGPLDDPALEEPDRGPSFLDDSDTVLCFDCRTDELARLTQGADQIPPAEWPVTAGAHDYAITLDLDPDRKP